MRATVLSSPPSFDGGTPVAMARTDWTIVSPMRRLCSGVLILEPGWAVLYNAEASAGRAVTKAPERSQAVSLWDRTG